MFSISRCPFLHRQCHWLSRSVELSADRCIVVDFFSSYYDTHDFMGPSTTSVHNLKLSSSLSEKIKCHVVEKSFPLMTNSDSSYNAPPQRRYKIETSRNGTKYIACLYDLSRLNGRGWYIKRAYGTVARVFLLFLARNSSLFKDHFVRSRFRPVWSQMQFLSRQHCRIRGIAEFSWPTRLNFLFLSTPKIQADGEWPRRLNR